jgi:GTP-binding protein HflX
MIEMQKESAGFLKKALLIGIQEIGMPSSETSEHIAELSELVRTLGFTESIEKLVCLKEINPKYIVGSGKAAELANFAKENSVDCVIFDHDLSPSQQRNWEALTKLPVIDRQEVIIDIFAKRAKTKEASIQVELARLQYSLPRLKRAWTHLSRQKGGALGTRGEGEQQIEVDRRIVKKKISSLQKSLLEIKQRRDVQRYQRGKSAVPQIAVAGYTNAGKSSLLNALTASEDAYVEDKLFATLDTTSRHFELPNKQTAVLTDTVGFVRKLPHGLVEAFKSTLEEAALSDLLIHVLDINSRFYEEHWRTTLKVLEELGAGDKEIITVFNKSDLQDNSFVKASLKSLIPGGIFISAKTGLGLEELKQEIILRTRNLNEILKLEIPPSRHDISAFVHKHGRVLELEYEENGTIKLSASIAKIHRAKLIPFLKKE